jgi:hypothetical protein
MKDKLVFIRKLLFIVLLSSYLPACAFVDNEVQLEYQEVANITKTSDDLGIIYLGLFEDARTDRSRIGVIKNAYGMETAKVLSKDDPVVWISNTLKGNLQRKGYSVETVKKGFAPAEDQFFLTGKITKVMSDPKMGFWTIDVTGNVDAIVQANYGGRQKERVISGQSVTTSMLSTGGDLHKGVLNGAIADFVTKVISWLDELKG